MRVLATAAGSFSLAVFAANCIPLLEGALAQACEAAREERASECLAVLLEQRRRKGSAGAEKRFDL